MIDFDNAEERLSTAGEYVLGTLRPQDALDVEATMRQDASLRRDVYLWQDSLLALSARAEPVEPPRIVWQRIENAVDAASRRLATSRWWHRARPWQAIGGLAIASSVVLAVLLVQRATTPPRDPRDHYLAVLQSPADHVNGWLVEIEADRLRLVPVTAATPVPAGRSLQFWTKPQGATAPTSLGLVRAGETIELPSPRLPGAGDQQLFEITLEPENGSPLGRPTGPILFVGRTVHL